MSHSSEERVSDSAVSANSARVVPFQRPQSELQRAVQERAQESMARERDRASQRPPPWRRVLLLVLAAVPVALTFGAALAFVGALRQFNSAVFNSTASSPAPTETSQAPTSTPSTSDVVMLQPFATPPAPPKDRQGTVSPSTR
jgi:hypothetical protein